MAVTRAFRARLVFTTLVAVLSLALLALGTFTIANLSIRVTAANERNAEQLQQIDGLLADLHASQENAQRLYDQLLGLGEAPDGDDPDAVSAGPTGPSGATGPRGPQGETGPAGAAGEDGAAGSDGATGAAGGSGVPGPQGDTGPQGPQGVQGETGAQGPAGPSCPEGYSLQLFTVQAIDPVTGLPYNQPAALCAPTP